MFGCPESFPESKSPFPHLCLSSQPVKSSSLPLGSHFSPFYLFSSFRLFAPPAESVEGKNYNVIGLPSASNNAEEVENAFLPESSWSGESSIPKMS